MDVWLWTLGTVGLISLSSFAGIAFLSQSRERLDRMIMYLVSLAAGVLLGGAVIHLIPRAAEGLGPGLALPLYFLGGFLGLFFLERFLWSLHHVHTEIVFPEEQSTAFERTHSGLGSGRHRVGASSPSGRPHPVVTMTLVGDSIHNFIDGMLIAAAFTANISLGLITAGAVLLHEIPQEIGDFGVLVKGGLSPRKALLFNFLSASMAILGAIGVLAVGVRSAGFMDGLIATTAGTFVYIAAADLIPEIQHHHGRRESVGHAVVLVAGVGLMLVLRLVEGGLGGV